MNSFLSVKVILGNENDSIPSETDSKRDIGTDPWNLVHNHVEQTGAYVVMHKLSLALTRT